MVFVWDSLMAQMVKNLPAMQGTWVPSLSWEDPLEEGMATLSSILAWRIPVDRGAWWATVHGVAKSWAWQRLSTVQHIPLYKFTTTYLSILLFMNSWVVSSLKLSWIVLLRTLLHFFGKHMQTILWSIHLGAELLCHIVMFRASLVAQW